MGKRKKVRSFNNHKAEKAANRKAEIEEHGKLISLRPGRVFKSKKEYNRKNNKLKEQAYDTDLT